MGEHSVGCAGRTILGEGDRIPESLEDRSPSLKRCLCGAFIPRVNVPSNTGVVLAANDPFTLEPDDIHPGPPTTLSTSA